ncbi:MAG TPA: hypothetical protein VF487_10340 [Chitinophagaceae bacterium]
MLTGFKKNRWRVKENIRHGAKDFSYLVLITYEILINPPAPGARSVIRM